MVHVYLFVHVGYDLHDICFLDISTCSQVIVKDYKRSCGQATLHQTILFGMSTISYLKR